MVFSHTHTHVRAQRCSFWCKRPSPARMHPPILKRKLTAVQIRMVSLLLRGSQGQADRSGGEGGKIDRCRSSRIWVALMLTWNVLSLCRKVVLFWLPKEVQEKAEVATTQYNLIIRVFPPRPVSSSSEHGVPLQRVRLGRDSPTSRRSDPLQGRRGCSCQHRRKKS